ncbi:CST complex subunit CTC1 isoform X2 [Phalaenopsis equestris]|uniref:CST complex subunit CTC1 isoform X2 n=1 Tax=Phalaenopsis equestris TaxID=78828 RepID=UPI0009E1FED7|nr:CST complex subunit CTC1 isoform X2 [Phalaenopsis equestris]
MPVSMAEVQIITIADLLSLSLPLTGATSLSPSSCSPPLKKHKPQPPHVTETENLTSLLIGNKRYSNRELSFTPFKCPVSLHGTVDLPIDPSDQYFSFCDGFSSISCAILDFELRIIGCKVHVHAWNFLPFKNRSGGLLEIIRWSTYSALPMPNGLSATYLRKGAELSSRKGIAGVLKSVSPVFTVPCRNTGSGLDSIGFLAEIFTCKCSFCFNSFSMDRFDYSSWKQSSHCFAASEFVYFLKPSGWRVALVKLVGKVIMVSGLKKKIIFVGEKTSYAIYVTPLDASVSLGLLPLEAMYHGEDVRTRMTGDVTVYDGVVTGVYMQGMAVELDEKVWLLVTDPNIAPLAALRISIRNFQLLRPVFSWIEISLLVSCCRTTIDVKAFSLSDTRCHFRSQSQSLLGKFMESLIPTARFWLLLLISCFRRKFGRLLTNKEIVGSRNKEGMVQVYAHASLHSHFLQPQHGIFMEFCQHEQSTAKYAKNVPPLKMVVPMSNFISKCEIMWASIVKEIQCHDGKLGISDNVPCKVRPSSPIIRRIISSDILGCILMGSIKSTSSGKLQLVDATGTVDVMIPDIVSSFYCQGIHEVKEFKVILEGPSMQVESAELHSAEELSCSGFFKELPVMKKINQLVIYVLFYLEDSTCLNAPINLPLCMVDNAIASGIVHLLLVTHKFPAAETNEVDTDASHSSSLFAEALFLPFDAIFLDEVEHSHPSGWDSLKSKCDLKTAEARPVCPFLLTFSRSNCKRRHFTGYFFHKRCSVLENMSGGLHPVLLEFLSDSFIKYQSLRAGGYYIMKCSKDCPFCFKKDEKKQTCAKVLLSSRTTLWKVCFSFETAQHQEQPSCQTSREYLIRDHQTCSENVQNDLVFQQLHTELDDISDVHLVIPWESLGVFSQIDFFKEELFNHFSMLQEVFTVTSFVQIMKSNILSPLKHAGSRHESLFTTNLISIRGNVENMHFFSLKFGSLCREKGDRCHGRDDCICLHVYDDQNMVYIQGKQRHYAYPVGLGPGVNATFHRVLLKDSPDGFPKLVLTSVSLVVINSVKEIGFPNRIRPTMLPQFDRNNEETLNSVSLSFMSNLSQLTGFKLARLLCRVVTIHFLILEKLDLDFGGSELRMEKKMPSMKIPLAGFLLDDGSSLCCCWAEAERAKMLLRLDEISCHPFFQCGADSVNKSCRYHETIGYQLDGMLRKHQKIIVKNYRAVSDVSSLDFMFHGDSSQMLSSAEERLLRLVIDNACQGSTFNIIGRLMDSNALDFLDRECKDLQDIVRQLPNIWAAEVQHINSLKEARNLLDELKH